MAALVGARGGHEALEDVEEGAQDACAGPERYGRFPGKILDMW